MQQQATGRRGQPHTYTDRLRDTQNRLTLDSKNRGRNAAPPLGKCLLDVFGFQHPLNQALWGM